MDEETRVVVHPGVYNESIVLDRPVSLIGAGKILNLCVCVCLHVCMSERVCVCVCVRVCTTISSQLLNALESAMLINFNVA